MLKKLTLLFAITIPIYFISGCGGTSNSGSTSLYETSTVSFSATTVNSTSTVIPKPNIDDSATKATLTVIVTPYPNFTASPFTVRDLHYIYTQTSGGTEVFTVNGVNFSTDLIFNPVLASAYVMDKLVDLGFAPGSTSLTQPWMFNVQAVYTVVEDNSGKSKTYSVPLGTLRFV